MPHSDETTVHFTCPRCMSWLKAPARMAKLRRRCPRCQLVVEVPGESRKPINAEGYGLQQGSASQPATPPDYIPVVCHLCHTRMYGTVAQVGQTLVCPDCGTSAVIPPPPASRTSAAKQVMFEEYSVLDEAQPISNARHDYEKSLIRVFCPRCNTMMYAEANQVGQELVCPDCRTPTKVPHRSEQSANQAHEIGSYALIGEVAQTSGETLEAEQTHLMACCSLCGTRLDVTSDQAGQTLVCPDCGRPVVVPSSTEKGQGRGAIGVNKIWSELPVIPEYVPHRDYRDPEMVAAREAAERDGHRQADDLGRPSMRPLRLLFIGTFSFPFSQDTLGRTMSLAATAVLGPFLLAFGFAGGAVEAGGWADAAVWIGKMMFAVSGMGILVAWIVTASVCGLAILRGTAYGSDVIEDYPNVLALEGLVEPVYVVFAAIFGALPGAVVLTGRHLSEDSAFLGIGISQFLFTPICLLSMLETGFVLNPFSVRVWQSVWCSRQAWGLFYVLSLALVAGAIVIEAATVAIGGWIMGTIVCGAVVTLTWLIYFRLLGRLAWFCSGEQHSEE